MKLQKVVMVSLLFFAVVLVINEQIQAEGLTGKEIIKSSNTLETIDDLTTQLEMIITHSSGQNRVRELEMYSLKGEEGVEKSLIRFLSPADVRGTGLLSINHPGDVNENYLYLPALGRPRRLSSEERGGSFMGSDFTYEDLSPNIEDYNHQLLGTEELEGVEVYLIESTPLSEKVAGEVGFARKVSWIRTDYLTLVQAETRDSSDKVLKRLKVLETRRIDDELWMPVHLEVETLEKGSRTILKYKEIDLNTGLDDSFFNIRYLTRPI